MTLAEMLGQISPLAVAGSTDAAVTGIAYDSRRVRPGFVFVAVRGVHADGHRYIRDAVSHGAAAVMYEDAGAVEGIVSAAALIRVGDSRQALAAAAAAFHGYPSRSLHVTGVTGTNGKTTTTYILKSIFEAWGKKVGLIGTIQYLVGADVCEAPHTTPEAPEFQELMRKMLDAGCSHVVTEVSSHALAQHRTDATAFRTAVFTNLTRDHLDYHITMEEYFSAKQRLFRELLAGHATAVVNFDDAWGRKLISGLGTGVITYGLETGSDLRAADISNSFQGLRFTVIARDRRYEVSSPLMGLPNVYNILAAVGAAQAAGVPWPLILDGIRMAQAIPGRFERVDAGQRFLAVIDYAHTEDALERLIFTARGLTEGRVITVFGCGGDRDRGKRPAMGAVATRLSDSVIITTDNPRSEDPAAIIAEVEKGAARRNYLIEPDRAEAIRRAVLMAHDNDVVLVAGKGHECYQEMGGSRMPFSDRKVLEEAIRQHAGSA